MPTIPQTDLVLQKIMQHYDRAAAAYDKVAVLQQEVGRRMLQRLAIIKLQPKTILDLGSGTSYCYRLLKKQYPRAKILSADLSLKMLVTAKSHSSWFDKPKLIQATVESLPLPAQSIDFIFCNQLLCWCPELPKIFKELKRILAPGGLLMFSTLGPDSLKELRQCWQQIDNYTHVHSFFDMHDLGDMLLQTHLADPVMDMEYLTLTYSEPDKLLRDLRANGASNASHQQRRTLTGKGRLAQCLELYERYRTQQGLIPATFEIIYGHAWQPLKVNYPSGTNEIGIPLSSIRKRA